MLTAGTTLGPYKILALLRGIGYAHGAPLEPPSTIGHKEPLMRLIASSARQGLRLLPAIALLLLTATASAQGPTGLTSAVRAGIDSAAVSVLATTGAPSVSIAVVENGTIAYVKAYGLARFTPPTPATPTMRYCIGSISKQFAATTLAMLADEGKLTLDDRVAKFFPDLTRAGDITVRELLSHTAGVRDYWPQDFLPASMREPITTQALMDRWARQPLDFEPGTRYQYSNTGYVIAGAIAEKVTGRPLMDLLRERIFTPLGMTGVLDVDQGRLAPADAVGYMNYGLGPQRPAPKEGRGWLFAAGELAMTAEDLARWDVSLIERRLLSSSVYKELTTEVRLENGAGTHYGLGIDVGLESARRVLSHAGGVSGFTAENRVYPEENAALVVLTNHEGNAASTLADQIANLLFVTGSPADSEKLAQARAIFANLQQGTIDRSLLTPNANDYFSPEALGDFKASLGPLGPPQKFELKRQAIRGGLVTRVYRAVFDKRTLEIVTRAMPDGRFEQYRVTVE